MSASKSASLLSYDKCRCNWDEGECAKQQQTLAAHCVETNQIHPLLGYVRIQKEQGALQKRVIHLLGPGFKGVAEFWVARHHFPLGLMQRNGNKSHRVEKEDGTQV